MENKLDKHVCFLYTNGEVEIKNVKNVHIEFFESTYNVLITGVITSFKDRIFFNNLRGVIGIKITLGDEIISFLNIQNLTIETAINFEENGDFNFIISFHSFNMKVE